MSTDVIDVRADNKVLMRVKDELLALALEALLNRSAYAKAVQDDGLVPLVTDDLKQIGPRTILVVGPTAVASKNGLALFTGGRVAGLVARDVPTQFPYVLAAVKSGCGAVARVVIERAQSFPDLTGQQMEVLARLIEGEQNSRIGQRLGLSEATVKRHVSQLFEIFDARTRIDLARCVSDLGMKLPV